MPLLLADIGGTNSRCALARDGGEIAELRVFRNTDFADLKSLLCAFLGTVGRQYRPTAGALAIAAPICGDEVQMMNIAWRFSVRALTRELGLEELHVVNDFAALAWALPALRADELLPIGNAHPAPGFPKVVLGPGTGLGVASLVPVADGWLAVAGEGGHVTLAAHDEEEARLIAGAREFFGHCSAERLLSGSGLVYMHRALHGGADLTPEEIGRRIAAADPAAVATLETFFRLLGTVAGNAALTLGALGGVYIAGGIVPRYADRFAASGFRERFEAKGRYRDYMRNIPTWLVTAPNPALTGLQAYWSRHRAA